MALLSNRWNPEGVDKTGTFPIGYLSRNSGVLFVLPNSKSESCSILSPFIFAAANAHNFVRGKKSRHYLMFVTLRAFACWLIKWIVAKTSLVPLPFAIAIMELASMILNLVGDQPKNSENRPR